MTFRAAILSCSALALVPSAIGEEGDKPWSQADAIWGEEAMAEARAQVLEKHGDIRSTPGPYPLHPRPLSTLSFA